MLICSLAFALHYQAMSGLLSRRFLILQRLNWID